MHGRFALGLAALTLLLISAPASAHEMTWNFASLVARDYWQDRNVTVPCEPAMRVLTDDEDTEVQASYGFVVDMLADVPNCTVLVTPVADFYRSGMAWLYCQEIVHEIGHLAGLDHDYGDVMDHAENVTPFACAYPRQWMIKQGWRKAPQWVRNSPRKVERLWLAGRVWRAQVARARWLERR